MLTYLRYALATFCFAASVGCLALWWRSTVYRDLLFMQACSPPFSRLSVLTIDGLASVGMHAIDSHQFVAFSLQHDSALIQKLKLAPEVQVRLKRDGVFAATSRGQSAGVLFPLWYPALIFALFGVTALRLGRRFTLRSAIIAMTVVAGLLGMAVAL